MRKLIMALPIRLRAAFLLIAILSLGFLPLLDAIFCTIWKRGLREFWLELDDCYSPWWKAVKAVWAALITGEQQ